MFGEEENLKIYHEIFPSLKLLPPLAFPYSLQILIDEYNNY
jgi:hypothetical protein